MNLIQKVLRHLKLVQTVVVSALSYPLSQLLFYCLAISYFQLVILGHLPLHEMPLVVSAERERKVTFPSIS